MRDGGGTSTRENKTFATVRERIAKSFAVVYKSELMTSQYYPLDPRLYVRDELEMRQKRRPQYSMRAFARDLEISPSFLCEFLAGRQGLSRARAQWIAEKIKLTSEQSEHFWDLIQSRFGYPENVKKAATVRVLDRAKSTVSHLNLERFHLVADWYCFPLLEILGLPVGPKDLNEISRYLDVPVENLQSAAERMERLGLLSRENDTYRVLTAITTVGENVDDRAVQIAHQQTLLKHAQASDEKPLSERDNCTVAFAVQHADWPALRRDLSKAIVDTVAKYAGQGSKDQVVSLTMQVMTLLPPVGERL